MSDKEKRNIRRVLRTVRGLSRDDREWLTGWLAAHYAGASPAHDEDAWRSLGEIVAGAKENA